MKNLSLILTITIVVFVTSCGLMGTKKDKRLKFISGTEYNAYIVGIITNVDEAFLTCYQEEYKDRALAWIDTLVNCSKTGLAKLNNLQPFEKDSVFRNAGISYLTQMNNIANKELKELININRADEMTVEDEKRAEDLLSTLDAKMDKLFAETEKAQTDFANKFNILINKNSEIFSQRNGLYGERTSCINAIEYNDYIVSLVVLIDATWNKAMDETDLKKALTASNEMKNISGAVIKSLKKLEGYDGETDFKLAASNYATHMNNISKKELPKFLKLIRAKDEIILANAKQAQTLSPILDDKRESLFSLIQSTQNAFALKHDFTIEK